MNRLSNQISICMLYKITYVLRTLQHLVSCDVAVTTAPPSRRYLYVLGVHLHLTLRIKYKGTFHRKESLVKLADDIRNYFDIQ